MATTPITKRMRLEYQSTGHVDEFVNIIDSLGRIWNPLKHPRDRFGRFIRTYSFVSFSLPGSAPGSPSEVGGRVAGIDKDGTTLVKITAVPKSPPVVDGRALQVGDYYRVKTDQVQVQTVKARIRSLGEKKTGGTGGNTHKGRLNNNDAKAPRNAVKRLRSVNLDDLANKMQQAVDLATADYDIKTAADEDAVRAAKQRAIDLFREVGEAVADERAKGYDEGDDLEELQKTLPKKEVARLNNLDNIIKATFTARHALGDRVLEAESDRGKVKAKESEVRIGVVQNELIKDQGSVVWDGTGPTLTKAELTGVQETTARDTLREDQSEGVLPELARAVFQRSRTGLNRSAGYRQAQQVAPADRWHVDKDGDQVAVGTFVDVAASARTRREFKGMIQRIHTDKNGKKVVRVRDFVRGDDDPAASDPRYAKGYYDFTVTSKAIKISDGNADSALYQQLANMGLAQSFVESFTEEMIAARRLAGPGAKRLSPTSGLYGDLIPVQDRVRPDINGESIKIGDHVAGPNGEIGVAVYIDPNSNTVRMEMPNGQNYARYGSTVLTRIHGSSSDVFMQDTVGSGNNYIPTREEASSEARSIGANQVADAIESGGDAIAIQDAMVADPQFQSQLASTTELFDRRDQALASGHEPDTSDQASLKFWEKMASASSGQFREPTQSDPVLPAPPSSTDGAAAPQDPANPTRTVNPDGSTSDGAPAPDDTPDTDTNTPPAPDAPDTDADAGDDTQADTSLAGRIISDLSTLADRAKRLPNVNGTQRGQLDKWIGELTESIEEKDTDRFIKSVDGMSKAVHSRMNLQAFRGSDLSNVLLGSKSGGTPLADFLQAKVDAGTDLFSQAPPPATTSRPQPSNPVPDAVNPVADGVDNDIADNLFARDGSVTFLDGDGDVTEGFFVLDASTVQDYDDLPTVEDIKSFFEVNGYDGTNAVTMWQDDNGVFHLGMSHYSQDEDEAKQFAQSSGTNQYVNIADGTVHNIAASSDGTDDAETPESVEDERSEQRSVRRSGTGKASAKTTSKQQDVLDQVAGSSSVTPEIADIVGRIKSGEEIEGADASLLADFISGLGTDEFAKTTDKALAQQLADKLARATGETGARPYPSQATAQSKTSQVALALDAQSQDDAVRDLTEQARQAVKSGDFATAADLFNQAADAFEELGLPNNAPAERAREHAERLIAARGTSGPDTTDATPSAPTDGGTPVDFPVASPAVVWKRQESADYDGAFEAPDAQTLLALDGKLVDLRMFNDSGVAADRLSGRMAVSEDEKGSMLVEVVSLDGEVVTPIDPEDIHTITRIPEPTDPDQPVLESPPEAPQPETPSAPAPADPAAMRTFIRGSLGSEGSQYIRSQISPDGETVSVAGMDAQVTQTFDITEDAAAALSAAGIDPTSFSELDRTAAVDQAMLSASDSVGDGGIKISSAGRSVGDTNINSSAYRFIVSDDGASGVAFSDAPNDGTGNIVKLYAPSEASLHATISVAVSQGANRILLSTEDQDNFDVFTAHGFTPSTKIPAGTTVLGTDLDSDHIWFVLNPEEAVPVGTDVDLADVPEAKLGQAGTSVADVAAYWAQLTAQIPDFRQIVNRDPESMVTYHDRLDDLLDTIPTYGVTNYGNNQLSDLLAEARENAPINQAQYDEAERLRSLLSNVDQDSRYGRRLATAMKSFDDAVAAKHWQSARDAIQQGRFVENNPDGVGGSRPDMSSKVTPAIVSQMMTNAQALDRSRRGSTHNAAWNDWLDNNEKPQVVSSQELDDLVGQGWIQAYRSVSAQGPVRAPEMIDNIRNADDYYVGSGVYGNGLYFSDHLAGSLGYVSWGPATNPDDDSAGYVRAVIAPDARWISSSQVYSLARAYPYLSNLDMGIIASIFGYDVIVRGGDTWGAGGGETYYNVINRGVLVMEDVDHGQPIDPAVAAQQWEQKQALQNQQDSTDDAGSDDADSTDSADGSGTDGGSADGSGAGGGGGAAAP